MLLSDVIPLFLEHIRYEEGLADETILKYRCCLNQLSRYFGDEVEEIGLENVRQVKKTFLDGGKSKARINYLIISLRRLLKFCEDELGLNVLTYTTLHGFSEGVGKRFHVAFLDTEEVDRIRPFLPYINLKDLRFRTFFEVLLFSGMRISEALSLDRDKINWEKGESMIIGKGNKERLVFFGESLNWIKKYLAARQDNALPIFISYKPNGPERWTRHGVIKQFELLRKRVNFQVSTKLRAHILRHTYSTWLKKSGVDLLDIKTLLGHASIQTTTRFYTGIEDDDLRLAHQRCFKKPEGDNLA